MQYRIEDMPEMRFVGYRNKLYEDYNENKGYISKLWEKSNNTGKLINLISHSQEQSDFVYGITSFLSDDWLGYYIAVPADCSVPKNMAVCELPAAKWAVFEVSDIARLGSDYFFKLFYTQWLPFSGYDYAEIAEIEKFSLNGEHREKQEIWISVVPQNKEK